MSNGNADAPTSELREREGERESQLRHEYLGARTPAMEYLFADAAFISLKERTERRAGALAS